MLALSACTKDVDLDVLTPVPTLVLNSVISPDHDVVVKVSETRMVHRPNANSALDNATVTLSRNGQPAVQLIHAEDGGDRASGPGSYTLPLRLSGGDGVRLEVTTPDGRRATAEDVMPRLVPIAKHEVTFLDKTDAGTEVWRDNAWETMAYREATHHITFTDPAGERNYYFVIVKEYRALPQGESYTNELDIDYSKDQVFRDALEGIDQFDSEYLLQSRQGRVFSDDRFDGETYTLRLAEYGKWVSEYTDHPAWREISLYSISEAYYRYLSQTLGLNDDTFNAALVEAGLADPPITHSNVQNGVGILGLMQVSRKLVNVGAYEETPTWKDISAH